MATRTSKRPVAPKKAARSDGWANEYTGFGTSRDRTMAAAYCVDYLLQAPQLESMYYGNDLCATLVDAPVDEAFRDGFCLEADDDPAAAEFYEWTIETFKLRDKIVEACKLGRAFGGCLLVFGVADGEKLDQPLNRNRANQVDWILPLDKRWVQPLAYYSDLGPKLGDPAIYQVNYSAGWATKSFAIHESRVVRFSGTKVDLRRRSQLSGWDQSVLQRAYDVLRQFEGGWQAAAIMLSDASQGVFKIANLMELLSSKDERANMQARLRLLDMSRSVARSIVVDADKEDFTRVPQTFTGLPDLLDRFMFRLSAAFKIPVSLLMGRSPAGMNSTGDMDRIAWEKQVNAYRKNELNSPIMDCLSILSLDKRSPANGLMLDGLCLGWHPLSELTEKEEAEIKKLTAETDQIYLTNEVFTPEQIAIARAGRGEWSDDMPEVDVKALQAQAKQRATFEDPAQQPLPNGQPNANESPAGEQGKDKATGAPPSDGDPTD